MLFRSLARSGECAIRPRLDNPWGRRKVPTMHFDYPPNQGCLLICAKGISVRFLRYIGDLAFLTRVARVV